MVSCIAISVTLARAGLGDDLVVRPASAWAGRRLVDEVDHVDGVAAQLGRAELGQRPHRPLLTCRRSAGRAFCTSMAWIHVFTVHGVRPERPFRMESKAQYWARGLTPAGACEVGARAAARACASMHAMMPTTATWAEHTSAVLYDIAEHNIT